jgi:poly(3-hydroxybutyrate) depolymerase
MKTQTLTSVETEGFIGRLYTPETVSKKSVIVITGGDGGIKNADYIANRFAERGINALAVGYFGIKGVGRDLIEVPVEYIKKAITYLKEKTNCDKTAIYGLSKGGELSLLSASLFSDIDCVVAVVPNYYVASGFTKVGRPIADRSSWSFRGKPVPYASIAGRLTDTIKSYLRGGEADLTGFYKTAEEAGIPEEALIKVENSYAAILCLSTSQDKVWRSKNASEKVAERLKSADYSYDYQHISFDEVSHYLCPLSKSYEKNLEFMFKIEKKLPDKCHETRERAFDLAVDWIMKYNNT